MENCLRLAPPLSIATVKRLNKEDFFEIQCIPSINGGGASIKYSNQELYISPLKPYLVRRKFDDFKALQKSISLANVSISFPSSKHISDAGLITQLNEYIEKLFMLPSEIMEQVSMKRFFGEWIQDRFEQRPLLSKLLHSKITAMISLGMDTKDDALANILQMDNDLRASGVPSRSADATLSTSPDAGADSKRDTVVPTFEEFTRMLAAKYAPDYVPDDADERDTVLISPESSSRSRDTIRDTMRDQYQLSQKAHSLRSSTQSVDTVLSECAPSENVLKKSHSTRSTSRNDLSVQSETKQSKRTSSNSKGLYSPIKINTKQPMQSSGSSLSASSSPSGAVVIPSRKESRNWSSETLGLGSASSVKSEGKLHYKTPIKKDSSPLSATASASSFFDNQPPILSLREHSSEGSLKKSFLTLKIIPVSGSFSTIKVSPSLEYHVLLEKLCLVMGVKSMNQMRISYRELDSTDLIVIADKESWEICLDGLTDMRLSIFLNPK